MSRARARTERGTQSIERSSSMIEPLIRAIAYVSNLMSRSGSKRSIAPIRPSRPYETRSPSSTCAGRPLPSRPATCLTSGAYVRISRSRRMRSPLRLNSRQSCWVSSERSTTTSEDMSRRSSPERTPRLLGHPEPESGRGDRDHPGRPACERGEDGDGDEERSEKDEEAPERGATPLGHPGESRAGGRRG